MSQRLTLDRGSFKQFLSAQFQQIQRQGVRGSAGDRIDPQSLPDLVQLREEVKSGSLDLKSVINRLVKLTHCGTMTCEHSSEQPKDSEVCRAPNADVASGRFRGHGRAAGAPGADLA